LNTEQVTLQRSTLLEGLRHFMAMLTSEAERRAVNRKICYTKECDK